MDFFFFKCQKSALIFHFIICQWVFIRFWCYCTWIFAKYLKFVNYNFQDHSLSVYHKFGKISNFCSFSKFSKFSKKKNFKNIFSFFFQFSVQNLGKQTNYFKIFYKFKKFGKNKKNILNLRKNWMKRHKTQKEMKLWYQDIFGDFFFFIHFKMLFIKNALKCMKTKKVSKNILISQLHFFLSFDFLSDFCKNTMDFFSFFPNFLNL